MQGQLDITRLVFIDEAGAKTNMTRLYGRSLKGVRAYDHAPHGHWCTTTMISSRRDLVLRTKIHSRQTALTKPCHKLLTNRRHRAINSSPTCFMRIIIHAETLSANRKPDYGVAEETFTVIRFYGQLM